MKKSKAQIRRSIERLNTEELIPLNEIAYELHVTKEAVRRYAISGRRGVHLDALRREGVWYTSRAALKRFVLGITDPDPVAPEQTAAQYRQPKQGRSHQAIVEAVHRVDAEGRVSVNTLADELGVEASVLVRWITEGTEGNYLDGLNLGQAGWHSSREAIERFLTACEERASHTPQMATSGAA